MCSEEPRFVDSVTMTASQMADGNHTFRTRLVEEVNREIVFYRVRLWSRSSEAVKCPIYFSAGSAFCLLEI